LALVEQALGCKAAGLLIQTGQDAGIDLMAEVAGAARS